MSRALFLLLLIAARSPAADLPPGAVARLGDARFRAGGPVSHLALSPDGKRFATVRDGGSGLVTLTVWDATGRPLHEQQVTGHLFRGLVWGKEGAFALARGTTSISAQHHRVAPDDFRVWDFTDPDAAPPYPLSVIDLGRRVAYDAVPQHDAEYTDFQFSADGSRVAALWTGKGKHAVHVFELKPATAAAKLARVGTLDLGAEGAGAVRISADGRTVVTFRRLVESDSPPTADFAATAWDADSGKPGKPVRVSSGAGEAPRLSRGERDRITNRLMLTPDGTGVVTHFAGETTWGFDRADIGAAVKRRELLRTPYPPANGPRDRPGAKDSGAHAFFPQADAVAVAVDRQAVLFDARNGKALGRLEGHAQPLTAIAVSADGSTIATADLCGLVRLWDAKSFRPKAAPSGHRSPIEFAELSPDGKRLLTWSGDETVRLWDVATGKELRAFAGVPGLGEERTARPAFTPDGTAVLFSTAERLACRDLATTLEIPLPDALAGLKPRHAKFAPDGRALATWSPAGALEMWDWPGGGKRFALDDVRGPIAPDFTPDGAALVAGAPASLWDVRTGRELAKTDAPPRASPRLAPQTPDGQMSARAVSDGGIQLREVTGGGVRHVLSGHRGRVEVLGFTPDGSRLLTAGADHTILVWDTRLTSVPLPDALKTQTNATKLWAALSGDDAKAAYLAMARLAREPGAAVKLAGLKLKPATADDTDTDESRLLDARAIELLEALDSDDARALLRELAAGEVDAFRTRAAKRALK